MRIVILIATTKKEMDKDNKPMKPDAQMKSISYPQAPQKKIGKRN